VAAGKGSRREPPVWCSVSEVGGQRGCCTEVNVAPSTSGLDALRGTLKRSFPKRHRTACVPFETWKGQRVTQPDCVQTSSFVLMEICREIKLVAIKLVTEREHCKGLRVPC